MNTKIERFFEFILKEKTRNFLAFVFYILFIVTLTQIGLPLILEIICSIVLLFIALLGCTIYMNDWTDKLFEKTKGKLGKVIIEEFKKISKEIFMFIPILLISKCITSFILVGQPANQIAIEESFSKSPIFVSISAIIIAPIMEEFVFRLIPYRFIKNKTLYVIISSIIFAAMHVVNDTNPFYYIWFYMIRSLYYGYRYHKTKDILVPITMHSLNNLISTLLLVFS